MEFSFCGVYAQDDKQTKERLRIKRGGKLVHLWKHQDSLVHDYPERRQAGKQKLRMQK